MYSEKLERLIQLSIEDGVIDGTENSVLIKCAKEEGVDIDELTLYVNSLVKKRQRELEADVTSKAQKYEKDKKDAIGNICPKCGKQVPAMSVVCPYCGCEMVKTTSNESVNLLFKRIDDINHNYDSQFEKIGQYIGSIKHNKMIAERERQIIDAITLFPVPNTKEDIIEFLSTSVSQAKADIGFFNTMKGRIILTILLLISIIGTPAIEDLYSSTNEATIKRNRKKAWRTKSEQIIMKARSIQGDPDFQKQIDYYESLLKK